MSLTNDEYERKWCVYCHTNPNDNKKYIGITSQEPKKRWESGHGYSGNKYFDRAIKKYGWKAFKHEILFDGLTEKEACRKEIELISKYKTTDSNFGYNISIGGEGANGVVHTEETKRKISKSKTGKKLSEEHRKKISERTKGENHPLYGTHASEQTRKLQSIAKTGHKNPNFGKKFTKDRINKIRKGSIKAVVQIDEFGNIVKIWESSVDIGLLLECNPNRIRNACKTKNKVLGFYWIYKIEYDNMNEIDRENISKEKPHPRATPIVQLTINGEFVREIIGMSEASRLFGFDATHICACCSGRLKQHKGYKWMYSKDYFNETK